eukprot:gene6833-8163_t
MPGPSEFPRGTVSHKSPVFEAEDDVIVDLVYESSEPRAHALAVESSVEMGVPSRRASMADVLAERDSRLQRINTLETKRQKAVDAFVTQDPDDAAQTEAGAEAAGVEGDGYQFYGRHPADAFPVLTDLVEDHVRLRALGVAIITALFILLALAIAGWVEDRSELPTKVEYTSAFASLSAVGVPLRAIRAPKVRLLNSRGQYFTGEGADNFTFHAAVRALRQRGVLNTLDCSSDRLGAAGIEGTLEHARVREPCTPVLANVHAVADHEGVATFENLTFARGPAADVTYAITATYRNMTVDAPEQRTDTLNDVFDVTILTELPITIRAREPLPEAPTLLLRDDFGLVVPDAACTAFAWTEPDFWAPFKEEQYPSQQSGAFIPTSARTYNPEPVPLQRAFLRGQNSAVLSGAVSSVSGSDGKVTFRDLRVVTSTTPHNYIHFFCDGKVASWSAPQMAPSVYTPPRTPTFDKPVVLLTDIASVILVDFDPGTELDAVEGLPLTPQPSVLLLDGQGAPVVGATTLAVVAVDGDFVYPLMFPPRAVDRLGHAPTVVTGVISAPSDTAGVARFEALSFQAAGRAAPEPAFQLRFCAEGVCSEAAQSPVFRLKTAVAKVVIFQQPAYIRVNGTMAGVAGEPRRYSDTEPPVVQVLASDGSGLPGKTPSVSAWDLRQGSRLNTSQIEFTVLPGAGTGADGLASVEVRLLHATEAAFMLAEEGRVGIAFEVDGVQSPLSDPVTLPHDTALSRAGVCSTLRALVPPPARVAVGWPFNRSVQVQAVDATGAPVPDLLVTPVSVEDYTRAPVFYQFGGDGHEDYAVTGSDGIATMQYNLPYRVGGEVFPGPRADVVRPGPDGSVKLMYVGLAVNFSESARVRELHASAPTSFGGRSGEEWFEFVERWAAGACGRATECRIACVSDTFELRAENPLARVEVSDARDGTRELEYAEDETGVYMLSPFYPYESSSAEGEALEQSYWEVVLRLLDAQGAGVPGQRVSLSVLEIPDYMSALFWWEGYLTCPSVEVPSCFYDFEKGAVVKGEDPSGEQGGQPLNSSEHFTAFAFVSCSQPLAGSGSDGLLVVRCVANAGYPGQYTMLFDGSGISSKPVTYFVPNAVAKVEVTDTWTRDIDAGKIYTAGDNLPGPVLRLVNETGAPVQNYRASAWLVREDVSELGWYFDPVLDMTDLDVGLSHHFGHVPGSEAAAMFDFAPKKHQNILGDYTKFSSRSDSNGYADFPLLYTLDVAPGCYRYQFGIFPCGEDGLGCSILPRLRANVSGSPVLSEPTAEAVCITADAELAVEAEPSGTVSIGQRFAEAPSFSITERSSTEAKAVTGLAMMVVAVESRQDPVMDTGLRGGRRAHWTRTNCANNEEACGLAEPIFFPGSDGSATGDGGEGLPAGAKWPKSRGLSNNVCVFLHSQAVYGRCGPLQQEVIGAGSAREYFKYTSSFTELRVLEGMYSTQLTLQAARPLMTWQPNSSFVQRTLSNATQPIALRDQPAQIRVVTHPRREVELGSLFRVAVRASIESGAALRYARVTAHLADANGTAIETADAFLTRLFGSANQSVATDGAFPLLAESRAAQVTDRDGHARFALRIDQGVPGRYAVYFQVGGVQSRKSNAFVLTNRVTQVLPQFAGGRHAVHEDGDGGGYPAELAISPFEVVVMDAAGVGVEGLQPSQFTFNVFTLAHHREAAAMRGVEALARGEGGASERLRAAFALIVEGSRRLQSSMLSTTAEVRFSGAGASQRGAGVYYFKDARLQVLEAGTYRIQVLAAGVPSDAEDADHDLEVRAAGTSAWARGLARLNQAAVFLLIAGLLVGNEAGLPGWAVLAALLCAGGALAVIASRDQGAAWEACMYTNMAAIVVLLLFAALGVVAPQSVPTRTFKAHRRALMLAYVRRLVMDPAGASAASSAGAGKASNLAQLRAGLADLAGHGECFFYPQRVLAAMACSAFSVGVLMHRTILLAAKLEEDIDGLDVHTAHTVYSSLLRLEEHFHRMAGLSLGSEYEAWSYSQASAAHSSYEDVTRAVRAASVAGAALGAAALALGWTVFLVDIRGQLIRARRGRFDFDLSECSIADAASYIGMHISISAIFYLLIWGTVFLVVFLLAWDIFRGLLLEFLERNWIWLAHLLWPKLLSMVAKMLFLGRFATNDAIIYRGLFSLWDLAQLFLSIASGVVEGLMRWLYVTAASLVAVGRMERNALPQWIYAVSPVDAHFKATQNLIKMHHMFSNPTFRVGAWLLEDCGIDHRARMLKDHRRRRLQLRWQVALLLAQNPVLMAHRAPQSRAKEIESGSVIETPETASMMKSATREHEESEKLVNAGERSVTAVFRESDDKVDSNRETSANDPRGKPEMWGAVFTTEANEVQENIAF